MSYVILAQSHNAHIQDKMSYHQMFFSFLMVKIKTRPSLPFHQRYFYKQLSRCSMFKVGLAVVRPTATYGGLTPTQFRGGVTTTATP